MSLSSVHSSQNVYTNHFFQKASNQPKEPKPGQISDTYTINNSDEANKLSDRLGITHLLNNIIPIQPIAGNFCFLYPNRI